MKQIFDHTIQHICEKILYNQRIDCHEAKSLYDHASVSLLGLLADKIKKQKHGNKVYFIKNYHIEPTNICVYNCNFCSYSKNKNDKDAWKYSLEDILNIVSEKQRTTPSELHIVGACHPEWDVYYYANMLKKIRETDKDIHLKAFSAVELKYMFDLAGVDSVAGINILKEAGLQSVPGGGAEIFSPEIRNKICKEKLNADEWLNIHKTAHNAGISSNATILYGHIENIEHRIDHLERLRSLQDKTKGFNAFIPLKFRNKNNNMSHIKEVSLIEDLKFYAFSRIFLDNFEHIKAYWPMLGLENSLLAMNFGADDLDGTIEDTTKIYSMAGVNGQKTISYDAMYNSIKKTGMTPVERNSFYKPVYCKKVQG